MGLTINLENLTNSELVLTEVTGDFDDIPDTIGPRSINRFGKKWTSETLILAHFVYRNGTDTLEVWFERKNGTNRLLTCQAGPNFQVSPSPSADWPENTEVNPQLILMLEPPHEA